MKPLLRLGRRRSSWELQDASAIADVEFRSGEGHDLTPSAYEVDARDEHELRALTVQVCTEHAASFLGSPPTGVPPLDISGIDRPIATPGTTLFRYANSCHRELLFANDAELLRVVERIKSEITNRRVEDVTRSDMLGYASERLSTNDPEWMKATTTPQNASAWVALIQKHRKKSGPSR
jgi:hypothetical protein